MDRFDIMHDAHPVLAGRRSPISLQLSNKPSGDHAGELPDDRNTFHYIKPDSCSSRKDRS